MTDTYIYDKVEKLVREYRTRNPFKLMEKMNIVLMESEKYQSLKGYCFICNRTKYVVINEKISSEEKILVAAHELGHLVLHRDQLKLAAMMDENFLSKFAGKTEFQANVFAAELLISDQQMESLCNSEYLIEQNLEYPPELMEFKIYSMNKRGYKYRQMINLHSNFLK